MIIYINKNILGHERCVCAGGKGKLAVDWLHWIKAFIVVIGCCCEPYVINSQWQWRIITS